MKDLPNRVVDAISGFKFSEYEETADVDAVSTLARETWVQDLAEQILLYLLPISTKEEDDKIGELVEKFLRQYGNAKVIARRDDLTKAIQDRQHQVLAEAISSGLIKEF